MDLVGGGSVINGATLFSFITLIIYLDGFYYFPLKVTSVSLVILSLFHYCTTGTTIATISTAIQLS